MVLTMAAVAANKGIALPSLEASVEGRTVLEGSSARTHFASRLTLPEGLSPREQRILFNAARQCEVHKMLRGSITFEEKLAPAKPAPESSADP